MIFHHQKLFVHPPIRSGSNDWTSDSSSRPHLLHANTLIRERGLHL